MQRTKAVDRIGQRFGLWTIVGVEGYAGRVLRFRCRCDCGAQGIIPTGNLYRRYSTRCVTCGRTRMRQRWRRYWRTANRKIAAEQNRKILCWDGARPIMWCNCGQRLNVAALRQGTTQCRRCVRRDQPWRYPLSIGTIARRYGITPQAVSFMIGRIGWEAMLAHYEHKAATDGQG